jgi:hypothetical protein
MLVTERRHMARSPTRSQPSQPHGRGRSRFRRTEASRLVKAATDAGLTVLGIEAVGDSLRVITGKPGESRPTANPWDEVLPHAADQKRPT